MGRKASYLVEQIALILLALAFGSIIFPHIQSIVLNQYEQPNMWAAIMIEMQVAWKALLIAISLIMAMIALLWKHKENDDMDDIRGMLKAICRHFGISEDEWRNDEQKKNNRMRDAKRTKKARS